MSVQHPIRQLLLLLVLLATSLTSSASVQVSHGIAMHGDLKYGPDFTHFEYANPDAPKGGKVRLSAIGTAFDNLNPFILKGNAAAASDSPYESLTTRSNDEAFSEYGLIAESVEMPNDRSWVIFNIRPEARWHDGKPITADDVVFSLDTLKEKGHPRFRFYYAGVEKAEKLGERRVKFFFGGPENRELPLIVGQLPILPKHYWQDRDFSKTTLEPPLGSGAYKISKFEPGRFITYERVKDHWAKDLPINKGQHNFDEIRYDYYRDATVALEAFKAGEYDWRYENVSKFWATGYDPSLVDDGLMIKEEVGNERPTGMQAFIYNLRRPLFQDPRVRQALAYAFDFEWTNKNLFYGQYSRTKSYFSNSELASTDLPQGKELKILEPYRGRIPEEVFTQPYLPPTTEGNGKIRSNLKQAFVLLKQAGWKIAKKGPNKGKLVNAQGELFQFEILLNSPVWERIVLPYVKNLKRLGIQAKVRSVDSAQYQERNETFDFDMVVDVFGQSLSPGNEQLDYWSSDAAKRTGSRNTAGISDEVIDELVNRVITATDRESLVIATRALDRVLLWNHYVIPHWHIRNFRLIYWNKFSKPAITPKYDIGFESWWLDSDKEAALRMKQGKDAN
ncbi:MAG: extracellular solute-binding protein [Motiliproteus sp.]|nr:extracellular solute-binding protein [Motiliproteus sp.]MCW9052674.1 extracellular solute-binding protein [Motiliproteus sp.]